MNRRQFVKMASTCAGFVALLASAMAPRAAGKPNIVIVLTDDLGYGDVSFLNPESKVQTPHMDALAGDGL